MATYKVLQDIEAEDKLVGPLSLRQFVYAAVAAVSIYICVLCVTKGIAFLLILFLPIAAISGFFAFPWKGEQPTEIWALARLRFMLKPRIRVWNQSGVKEVVTILAPKKIQTRPKGSDLSQQEVQSRLKALAETIDSRGWATRNASYRYYSNAQQKTDRLINASDINPAAVPTDAFMPGNDMLDDRNPIAQNLDNLLSQSSNLQRQRVVQQMNAASRGSTTGPAQMPQVAPAQPIQRLPQPPQISRAPFQQGMPVPLTGQPASASTPTAAIAPIPMPAPPAPSVPATAAPQATPVASAATSTPPTSLWAQVQAQQSGAMPQLPAPNPTPNYWFVNNQQPANQATAATPSLPQPNQATQPQQYAQMQIQPSQGAGSAPNRMPVTPGIPGRESSTASASGAPAIGNLEAATMTQLSGPAILSLANNNDLNVETLARQARIEHKKATGEVEVRLH